MKPAMTSLSMYSKVFWMHSLFPKSTSGFVNALKFKILDILDIRTQVVQSFEVLQKFRVDVFYPVSVCKPQISGVFQPNFY